MGSFDGPYFVPKFVGKHSRSSSKPFLLPSYSQEGHTYSLCALLADLHLFCQQNSSNPLIFLNKTIAYLNEVWVPRLQIDLYFPLIIFVSPNSYSIYFLPWHSYFQSRAQLLINAFFSVIMLIFTQSVLLNK